MMEEEKKGRTSKTALLRAKRPIRIGIVGGGDGFIGPVHAIAARMDNRYHIVAGALSSKPEKSKAAGAEWFLDPDRCYSDYRQMAKKEPSAKTASKWWQ